MKKIELKYYIKYICFLYDADYNLAHNKWNKRKIKIYTRMNLEERKIMQNLLKKGHRFSQASRTFYDITKI